MDRLDQVLAYRNCSACNLSIRRDTTHYAEPRWVHVTLLATVNCPETGDITPAGES